MAQQQTPGGKGSGRSNDRRNSNGGRNADKQARLADKQARLEAMLAAGEKPADSGTGRLADRRPDEQKLRSGNTRSSGKPKRSSGRPKRSCGAHPGPDKRSVWVLDTSTEPPKVVRVRRNDMDRYRGAPTVTAPRGSAQPPVAAFYDPSLLGDGYETSRSLQPQVSQIDQRVESALVRMLDDVTAADDRRQVRRDVLAALRRTADPDRAARGMADAVAAGLSVDEALAAARSFGNRSLQFRPEPADGAADPAHRLPQPVRSALADAATLAHTDRSGHVDARLRPSGKGTFVSLSAGSSADAERLLAVLRPTGGFSVEDRNGRFMVRGVVRDQAPVAVAAALGLPVVTEVTVTDDGRVVRSERVKVGEFSVESDPVDVGGTRSGVEALVRHHLARGGDEDTYELALRYERGALPGDPPFEKALPALLVDHVGPARTLGEVQVRLAGRLSPEELLPPSVLARSEALPETVRSSTLGALPVWYRNRESAELLVDTVLHIGDPRIAAFPTEVGGRPTVVTVARFDDRDRIRQVEQVPVADLQRRQAAFVNRRCADPVEEIVEAVRLDVATGAATATAMFAVQEGAGYRSSSDRRTVSPEQQAADRFGFYAHTQPRRDLGAVAVALQVLAARPDVVASVSESTRDVMKESAATFQRYASAVRAINTDGEFVITADDWSEHRWTSVDQLRSPYPSPLKGEPRGSRDRARQAEFEAEKARLTAAFGEALSVRAGRQLSADEVDGAVAQVMEAASKAPGYARKLAAAAVDFDRRHHAGDVDGPGIF